MYYIFSPKKVMIYINNGHKTPAIVQKELGCDLIINGGLYDMNKFKPVLDLRADSIDYSMEYIMNGYGFNDAQVDYISSNNRKRYKDFISCVSLIENSQKIKLDYPAALGGVRGRTAIGRTNNNKIIFYCSKDGSADAKTPEALQTILFNLGAKDALMLDGGGSSQCIMPSGTITSARIVQNYICAWIKDEKEQPNTSTTQQQELNTVSDLYSTDNSQKEVKGLKYLDVSVYQGVIDWEKVKPNIDGVIIRAGYGQSAIDKQFERNAKECNRLGIPCGAYWFSYAYTVDMAKKEAQKLIEVVKPYKMNLPLAFDFEYDSVKNASSHGVKVTKDLATKMAYEFCKTIEEAGYWCLNYSNPDFLKNYFDESITERFGLWLAQYPSGTPDLTKKPRPDCQIWQWGTSTIPGITGKVDTNESYVNFYKIIKENNLNNLDDDIDEKHETEREIALKWAKSAGLVDDTMENKGDLALLIYRYHKMAGDK